MDRPAADVPLLRAERCVLRGWTESDRAPFAQMNADPVVMEFFPSRLSRAQSDAFVDRIEQHWREHGFGLWAVDVDDVFAGFVGLQRSNFEAWFTPAVEVGWRLAAWCWGRGAATTGARAALGYGFDRLGLSEVLSWTAVTNVRSWRVMQRLGMAPDGEFDHPGTPVDSPLRRHVLYRLRGVDWPACGS